MQQAIGFAIEKAPKGGYKLSRITGFTEDGKAKIEVVAYCTNLYEAQEVEHSEKTELFGASCWRPQPQPAPQPQHQPFVPASSVFPPSQQPAYPDHPDEALPKFAQDYASNGGLMGRFENAARAMLPALFVGAMWFAVNARFMA